MKYILEKPLYEQKEICERNTSKYVQNIIFEKRGKLFLTIVC